MIFLSTLSLRRATSQYFCKRSYSIYFYPRSPCGERHVSDDYTVISVNISIHALLAESDKAYIFSTAYIYISIHALLAESDFDIAQLRASLPKFLSTLSLRRATRLSAGTPSESQISIHALLAESDCNMPLSFLFQEISIHALLAESDRKPAPRNAVRCRISIHALLAESDHFSHKLFIV